MKKKRSIIYYLLVFFLMIIAVFPKIDIISIAKSSAGIRIDDIMIALLSVILIPNIIKTYKSDDNVKKTTRWYILYIIVCVISLVYGITKGYVGYKLGVLYLLRKIEYFITIFSGYTFFKYQLNDNKVSRWIGITLLFHFVFCILQYFGYVGSFHSGEIVDGLNQGRVSSTFNGAYEMSAFLLLLLPMLLCNILKDKKHIITSIIGIFIVFACTFISQSRISLIAFIVIVFIMFYHYTKTSRRNRFIILAVAVVVVVGGLLAVKFGDSKISQRLGSVSFKSYAQATECAWMYKNFDLYLSEKSWITNTSCLTVGEDYSWNLRVNHWMQLLDGVVRSPIVGTGLSISGSAADGEYIRIIAESGFLGFIMFAIIIINIIKTLSKTETKWSSATKYALYSMLIGSLFIDIFSASKVAMMFWFMLGMAYADISEVKDGKRKKN